MKKRFSCLSLIIIVFVAILITFQITFILFFKSTKQGNVDNASLESMDILRAVDYAYRNYYFGDLDEGSLERALIEGYIYGTGDKYGEYMDSEQLKEFQEDRNGKSVGIGISVVYNEDKGFLEIVNISPDTPAANSGVEIGDVIIKIYGENAAELGYYGALEKMKGENGTSVQFSVLRGEDEIDFDIERTEITQQNVTGHVFDDGKTGIVRIEEFDQKTVEQFNDIIDSLVSEGAQRFVFDVRNNPGGELDSVTDILDTLLPEGPIIRIQSKDGEETTIDSDEECLDFPMAVVTNENTASAAELFTSALKDYNKAVSVGKTTYGKGTMQTLLPLINKSALRLTIRMYKPPFSDGYDGKGITPDIEVDMAEDVKDINLYKLSDAEDTQLMKAIEYLENNN